MKIFTISITRVALLTFNKSKLSDAHLMNVIEQSAAERGCESVYLDTFDFQALPFYEKLGFKVFCTLENFPKGHKRIFVKKEISDALK